MPRASGSGKRQQGAGAAHRDSRHDHGLVGPGKRIAVRKSQGHLDGPARPGLGDAGLPPLSPQPSSSSPPQPPPANGFVHGAPDDAAPPTSDCRSADAPRRGSLGTSSVASSESHYLSSTGVAPDGHRHIDVNAMKNADVHRDLGPLDVATTVVRSLPVHDTLGILIAVTHASYLAVTCFYTMFVSLTFVPPVITKAGWNLNLGEIFDGSSHAPSVTTVVCMDVFFFLVWIFLWPPIQDFVLDFAKPVAAVTLCGGTSPKDGSPQGLSACIAWLLLDRLVRASKSYWARVTRSLPDGWRVTVPLESPDASNKRDLHGWIQSILAMHILTQGIVRYIREWYLRRERSHATDTEAGGKSSASNLASPSSSTMTTTTMGGPVPPADHAHDTVTLDAEAAHPAAVAKKKRKQSAQARLQQPLWSALASTKIVASKEMELSTWRSGANSAADKRDIHSSGNAPSFNRQPKQIWISYIGSDEACFNTTPFPEPDDEVTAPLSARPAGVDASKPFYVRINHAFWQPTRIFPIDGGSWTGDIYGLRPQSKYVCEFVDISTDQVLFTTSIQTAQEPRREHDAAAAAAAASASTSAASASGATAAAGGSGLANGQQPPLRPDSPSTTLRTSIAASEAKLADEKMRLKTLRKDWKARANVLRKENELVENQLLSAGGSDDKHRQKIRQQETQKAQAERDARRLAEQLRALDAAPEPAVERKRRAERAYSAEKHVFDAAHKELREHKARLEGEVKAKDVDRSNLNTRRNKTATRIAKLENELATVADANSRGLDEAERRRQDRARWRDVAAAAEQNYTERLALTLAANSAHRDRLRSLRAQLQALQGYLGPVNGMPMDVGPAQRPANPWNPTAVPAHYPPSSPWAPPAQVPAGDVLPPVSAPPRPTGLAAWQPPPRGARMRGRSSSMLSDVSGFTQASDDGPRSRPRAPHRRNGASGSSGSSGGSVGDVSPT